MKNDQHTPMTIHVDWKIPIAAVVVWLFFMVWWAADTSSRVSGLEKDLNGLPGRMIRVETKVDSILEVQRDTNRLLRKRK
jgi:hypothetical protein